MVHWEETSIVDGLTDTIYTAIFDKRLLQCCVKMGCFASEAVQAIDWSNQERAMKLEGMTRR